MAAEFREPYQESFIERRNILLKDVEPEIIHKAWFTMSHLMLADGARVMDMGCDDGVLTYCMAAMNPRVRFIGVDKNKRQVNKAKEKYELHNLEFLTEDGSAEIAETESIDCIINSFFLHEVFSGSRYNERIVGDTLRAHFKMLKKGGILFIRDYARPPPEEFVLLEMPDAPSKGDDLASLSEADLLVWYSEHARPRQDPGCGGFFLEERPARFPKTRLFYLPHKWAYEFIMRKDDRGHWEKELPMEYTFFTPREFNKELRALGARVLYTSQHWDEDYIEDHFEGRFRLYRSDGAPLGHPPTSYISLSVKMAERKSLYIEERRPSNAAPEGNLKITAVRNLKTGAISDIVTRDTETSEIIPYRINEEGRLKIFLHDGIARSIANAVPRNGINLDTKRWSGHMVEAITVDLEAMQTMQEYDVKHTVRFARDYLGLKPKDNAILTKGPDYYPAPDYIDERIYTFYLSVEETRGQIVPKPHVGGKPNRFQAKGVIQEMDAQQILNAITVGLIPNARLEMQILSLFNHLNIQAETWTNKHIALQAGKITQRTSLKNLIDNLHMDDERFKDIKGTAGQLRAVNSVFVEEGQTKGSISGLTSQEVDFVVRNDQTINTVVVLPLTKGIKGDVHAGFNLEYLPIPQRHEGKGGIISAPHFNLPPNITTMQQVKKFIADQFGVMPTMVMRMGESYFTHIGMTPHRIYPFAVSVPPDKIADPKTQFLPFYQLMLLRRSISRSPHFMIAVARAYKFLHEEIKLDFANRVQALVQDRFANTKPDWSLPLSYAPAPTMTQTRRFRKPEVLLDPDAEELEVSNKKEEGDSGAGDSNEPNMAALAIQTGPAARASVKVRLVDEFERELEEFIEALEEEEHHKPKPEKW